MKAQGMGVHKPEEIIEFGQNDLKVLSDMLADKPFFFGDEPTTVSMISHLEVRHPRCVGSIRKNLCITCTVKHNCILPISTVRIQLHVSVLCVDHLQVEIFNL